MPFEKLISFISILNGALYLCTGDEGVPGVIFTFYAIFSGDIVDIFYPNYSVEAQIARASISA